MDKSFLQTEVHFRSTTVYDKENTEILCLKTVFLTRWLKKV